MVSLKSVLSVAFWAFPTFFCCFWMVTRIVAYFFMDLEWNKKDFASIVLPDDVALEVRERFNVVIAAMFDPKSSKFYAIRIHTILGALMGFMCIIQLLPFMRRRYMKLHRKLGYLYCALLVPFAIEVFTTLYITGMAPLGPAPFLANSFSLVTMVLGTSVGVWAAKNHKVPLHRACMLINCAGLYVNPAQRFFWALISKNNIGGPYRSWPTWLDRALAPSELAAVTACFATALAYITVIKPGKSIKAKAA